MFVFNEIITALKNEGHPIFPGSTGENLTIKGMDWNSLKTGDKLKMGEVEIQLTGPTAPWQTIQNSFTNNQFSRISQKKNPGWSRWYAKVLKEGTVKLNDNVAFFPI